MNTLPLCLIAIGIWVCAVLLLIIGNALEHIACHLKNPPDVTPGIGQAIAEQTERLKGPSQALGAALEAAPTTETKTK